MRSLLTPLFPNLFLKWFQGSDWAALSLQDPSAPPLRAADPWGSPGGGGGGCGTSLVPAFGTGVSPLLSSAAARGPLGRDVTLGGREAEPSPARERSYELTETQFVLKQGRLAQTEGGTQTGAQICLANNNLCFVHE